MFPAPAGVSPASRLACAEVRCVPRTCGGKPQKLLHAAESIGVFPAPAGVSPFTSRSAMRCTRVPRTCGGKPVAAFLQCLALKCSPHLRG